MPIFHGATKEDLLRTAEVLKNSKLREVDESSSRQAAAEEILNELGLTWRVYRRGSLPYIQLGVLKKGRFFTKFQTVFERLETIKDLYDIVVGYLAEVER